MTFPELDNSFNKIVKDTQSNDNGTIMVLLAIDACTFMKQRIIEEGTNAKGQKYKSPVSGSVTYSTKPMLVGKKSFIQTSAAGALLGSKKKRKDLEWRTVNGHRLAILPGGYKKLRELQNRRTDIVNFSFTNKMWKDILVEREADLLSNQGDHKRGIAIIGARNKKYKDILSNHTNRFGTILDLSQKEIDQLKESYNFGVLKIFRNNGL